MTAGLGTYRTLGRSGLRVSRMALGAATFGTEWGWGADRDEARRIFDLFVSSGGTMIDTAATYTNGTSERLVGEFARQDREQLVLATKYSTLRRQGDPNSGGAQRKNLIGSVEASLRNLATDYIDLLYLHVWDPLTPIEEVVRGMDDLVRQGKVLYIAISTAPAWQVARMQTVAELRGWTPLVALQVEYNLIERRAETDLVPMAHQLGLAVVPFSPLAGGVLAGRYSRADLDTESPPASDGTRRQFNVALGGLDERTFDIVDVVRSVAAEIGCTPAQVGVAWVLQNPHVTVPVVGARTAAQLHENLAALDVELSGEQLDRLDAASAIDLGFPHALLASDHIRRETRGNLTIETLG